jgi:UDPglucose--hexose-1-phosphate uridylyltransferase
MTADAFTPLFQSPHRRYNPLLDEWVLCSPHRLDRPWQGRVEHAPARAEKSYDPNCYLCPGNTRAGGHRNPEYTHVHAFDNDFPALLMDQGFGGAGRPSPEQARRPAGQDDEFFWAEPAHGVCRVLCFSPHHELTLARLPVSEIALVVDAWAEEIERLGQNRELKYVQIFENKGEMMGASNPHPHCQIWATTHVPVMPARKTASQQKYFAAHGRDLLGDYLERELAVRERVIAVNEHWVVLVPFWAVWPFETMIIPRRRVSNLPSLERDERDALAAIVHELMVRYDNLFETSFPYTMGWHGQPLGALNPAWRLHATYMPPLLRSATVRKFLVGFEQMGEPQRDLTAEQAAERLRGTGTRRYLDELPYCRD